ncbi:helix-turn-helix transcriptional regulator [Nocardia arthritidis]|uniref:Helix-turn-helix domain-containing protein n=1 Tax=Nocardia arthritidis TaxID=228602 RepID=A0A6G9YPQ1_9NOCA|nr:helix-turn-helix transcriptional regulator [Nocardia arthritidis]QIS14996.1 helix-turn-helix domain-containing protein [Nocardia arthritidis]
MADETAGYRERPSRMAGAVLWTRTVAVRDASHPVLPDGCIDLIWSDGRLFIAGPDTAAQYPAIRPGASLAGIRFYPGTAPGLLGVPAHELRDRRVDLDELWPTATARRLTEQVDAAEDRGAALESIALARAAAVDPPDPRLRRIVTALDSGWTIAATAEAVGLGPRLLHRRSLAAFGYGPKTLARVLRLQRALRAARGGAPLAETAVVTGFADQAHLSRDVRELTGMPLRELLSR